MTMDLTPTDLTLDENAIVLTQGANYPVYITLIDGCPVPIASSVSGAAPVLNFAEDQSCFSVGDKVQVLHSVDGCSGLSGCGTIVSASARSISVEMLDGQNLARSGTANGYVAKALNAADLFMLGGIFSHLPSEPSPLGLQGAIDQSSNQILIKGGKPSDVRVGDLLTLAVAGITNARVLNVQVVRDRSSASYVIASVNQFATASISPRQMKTVTRRGAMLAQFRALPVGDGSTGTFSAYFSANDTAQMVGAESCDSACVGLREVGCYQFVLGRGLLGTPGYRPFYAEWLQEFRSGSVYLRPSILLDDWAGVPVIGRDTPGSSSQISGYIVGEDAVLISEDGGYVSYGA